MAEIEPEIPKELASRILNMPLNPTDYAVGKKAVTFGALLERTYDENTHMPVNLQDINFGNTAHVQNAYELHDALKRIAEHGITTMRVDKMAIRDALTTHAGEIYFAQYGDSNHNITTPEVVKNLEEQIPPLLKKLAEELKLPINTGHQRHCG